MNVLLRSLLVLVLATAVEAADWQPIQVPGKQDFTGTAWMRAWVKVHDSFFTKHERNLYEESVGVNIRDLAGAHEVWVNGRRIGSGGVFPPNYQSAGSSLFRHKVPVGTLRKGEWNEIAIRVHQPSGRGGFLGDAPFIMNYFMECVFEGEWEFRLGDDYNPGGAVNQKPARAAFETFRESQRVLGRTEQVPGPSLPPKESAAKLQAFNGLKVELLLSEPQVAQPFHFSFDERGRLWVAQTRQYPYPAGLTMLSRDKFYRSHYDKLPAAPPHHDRGADVISIHEDSDGDGLFDKHKVFVDGLNMANAVVRGRGGVWVMHTPYLLFYPDKDGDDVPDAAPVVHLSGFGFEDAHAMANGLVWGPDGWLYGAQGSTSSCRVRRPGLDAPDSPGVYFEGCMVWRYHPETRAFEIFAEGSGNTFGVEVDAQGRLYSGHNGGKTRGWHYVQGGFYLMQGVDPGKFGPPRNPYAFGELPMMATTDPVVRFTHFGAFADGSAMPSKLSGMLFAIDPLHNEIIASERKPRGATFETLDHGVVVKSSDPAFRPVYIANAPDGSLYVADMYEFYIAHGQHYQNQIDPTTGRIYRVTSKDAKLESDIDLAAKSIDQLIALLGHPNKWHRHTAARLLGERKDPQAAPALKEIIAKDTGLAALNALWALHQSSGLDDATAVLALQHPNAAVRLWTARLLGDEYGINRNLGLPSARRQAQLLPTNVFNALVSQAIAETDAEVRSQFAATARRLADAQAFPLVAAVMGHDEDANDPYIPLLCWWVFEARIPSASSETMEFFKTPALWDEPLVVQQVLPRIVRRFAVDGKRQELLLVARLLRQAPGPAQAALLLKGLEEAYRGRPMTGLPDELISAVASSGGASLSIRLRQGEAAAVKEALAIVSNAKAKLEDRLLYARSFGEVRHADAVPVLLEIAAGEADAELRKACFASLGAYDHDRIATDTLEALPKLPVEVRMAAFTLVSSRVKWTQALMAGLQSGKLSISLVPNDVAEQLRLHRDKAVRDVAAKLFPKSLTGSGYDFKRRLAEVEAALTRGAGNPYAGEATYMQRCASCHKLFFKGGNVGPELTGYQRDNLGTMLISIVNPNAEIREGFQFILVETRDGRIISGFQVDRDNQVTVLRGLDGQDVTISAQDINAVEPMGRSLMPEGLLEGLSEQQLRDLFAYLRISQPITK
ncbi:MAG: c-type cytochrome [Planctomycetes bacterium]|nr:c-type cytochrome [Planctomycetota bacterium]